MDLLFKQRFFSWFDSYDIFDENGNTVYEVKGKLSWGHCLHIMDMQGQHIGTVKERVLTLLPKFEIYQNDSYLGYIKKEFTFLKPRYDIDFNGWHIKGNFLEWDYSIWGPSGKLIATVDKKIWNWTDTYAMHIEDPADALYVLMLVLAIDAEKCSRQGAS